MFISVIFKLEYRNELGCKNTEQYSVQSWYKDHCIFIIIIITTGKSNLTQGRIAAADGRFMQSYSPAVVNVPSHDGESIV